MFSRQIASLTLLALFAAGAAAQNYAEGGSEQCLGCHDFGPESPVHAVLDGSHGAGIGMGERTGCEGCHGPSGDHANAPTQVSPAVSYGPRWTASTAAQDAPCLKCHEGNTAAHWGDSLHMLNNLACTTCHDIHTGRDKVLFSERQSEVCTVCHKNQKQGIHGLEEMAEMNPPCTSCHNPHNHESAAAEMLANRSEGCRSCHDLVQMAADGSGSDKARSYHKVMAQPDRSCLDCHQGIAHAAADSVPPMLPSAVARREVTLFFPGQSDSEWLLSEHPGSQPLRQGRNCQQCHRGEEAGMGRLLSDGAKDSSRPLQVGFARSGDALLMRIAWDGPASDEDLSVMWGDRDNRIAQRGGCFAACHSDMPGMSRDRGQQTGKYLLASRVQQQAVGRPALVKNAAELEQLRQANQFTELWRVRLSDGQVETAALLEALQWRVSDSISATAKHSDGRWQVEIRRPLGKLDQLKDFSAEQRFTFGIALHGDGHAGGRHWVSLPLTMGLEAEYTDFRPE